MKQLIDHNADINKSNEKGETALSLARQKKYNEIETLLIKAGAK